MSYESAVSNFHTNLYAIKRHNITAQSAPDFGHALSLFLGRIVVRACVSARKKPHDVDCFTSLFNGVENMNLCSHLELNSTVWQSSVQWSC